MHDSTSLGGVQAGFPATSWSVIRDASDPQSPSCRASFETLIGTYWKPVYAYLRRKWGRSNEDAKDLTQEFFMVLLERNSLHHYAPQAGRFRSYVRSALDNFSRKEYRRRTHGGNVFQIQIDASWEPPTNEDPDRSFEREWVLAVLESALKDLERALREEGGEVAYRIFREHEVDADPGKSPRYEALAQKYGVSADEVRLGLYRARQKMRELVRQRIADTVASSADVEAELQDLFEGAGG